MLALTLALALALTPTLTLTLTLTERFRTQLATYNISDSACPDLTDFESVADLTVPYLDRLKAKNLPVAAGPIHNTTDDGCASCGEDYEDIVPQDPERYMTAMSTRGVPLTLTLALKAL